MNKIYTVDELVANDSFINYCKQNNPDDQQVWQIYLQKHPEELGKVIEAKQMVKMIVRMLDVNKTDLTEKFTELTVDSGTSLNPRFKSTTIFKRLWPYAAAASVFFLIASYFIWFDKPSYKKSDTFSVLTGKAMYQTRPAERKTIWLPDSTRIVMNANTEIDVSEQFGINNREVSIRGEAFFEVTHNTEKPFIVKTPSYQIKVLGTSFNVKAYPGEDKSEASLIKGSIELTLNYDNNRKFLLKPDEKAIVHSTGVLEKTSGNMKNHISQTEKISIRDLTVVDLEQKVFAETAWINNRLEIVNQKFSDLAPVLERWYDVSIVFEDEDVQQYLFTATFEGEPVEDVFRFLRMSFPFQYKIENKRVYISK